MRGFSCHYYHLYDDGKIIKNPNAACFAGLNFDRKQGLSVSIDGIRKNLFPDEYVLIDDYQYEDTEEYVSLICNVINEITPCDIVNTHGKDFIRYKLLNTYDQNLILLNFIRNLWSNPGLSIRYKGKLSEYNNVFFKYLKNKRFKYNDPLILLTKANKVACRVCKYECSLGHSNVHDYHMLIPKTTNELLNYSGTSTAVFLTT